MKNTIGIIVTAAIFAALFFIAIAAAGAAQAAVWILKKTKKILGPHKKQWANLS